MKCLADRTVSCSNTHFCPIKFAERFNPDFSESCKPRLPENSPCNYDLIDNACMEGFYCALDETCRPGFTPTNRNYTDCMEHCLNVENHFCLEENAENVTYCQHQSMGVGSWCGIKNGKSAYNVCESGLYCVQSNRCDHESSGLSRFANYLPLFYLIPVIVVIILCIVFFFYIRSRRRRALTYSMK